jgi:hypothetical protein
VWDVSSIPLHRMVVGNCGAETSLGVGMRSRHWGGPMIGADAAAAAGAAVTRAG